MSIAGPGGAGGDKVKQRRAAPFFVRPGVVSQKGV